MNATEFKAAVASMRRAESDGSTLEAKAAQGGVPRALGKTLSAFSNTNGGTVLLGVDESDGFKVKGVPEPGRMQQNVQSCCTQELDPPVRPEITSLDHKGQQVIVIEVPPMDASQRPCYFKSDGGRWAYRRVGDSNLRLTPYEIHLMESESATPRDDAEIAIGASMADLDEGPMRALLRRVRELDGGSWTQADDETVLIRLGVLSQGPSGPKPTLAGLLALGVDPQTYFPQLNVTFVRYPAARAGAEVPGEPRFLDNRSIRGPIPEMVAEALKYLRQNMRYIGSVQDVGRIDTWEYPITALREAIVNALVHRDLHPMAHGAQVQIEMYPDRLVIRSPGGMHGPVRVEELGEPGISSSRNGVLMRLLESVEFEPGAGTVVENRASGIQAMIKSLQDAGMQPPKFEDKFVSFEVTFANHTLMGDDTVNWLASLHQPDLTSGQCMALAAMRSGAALTNGTYRAMIEQDSSVARQELQDLVSRGLVITDGVNRWTTYRLRGDQPRSKRRTTRKGEDQRQKILLALGDETLGRRDLEERVDIRDQTLRGWLRRMQNEGSIELVGSTQSNSAKYRATEPVFPDGTQLNLWTMLPDVGSTSESEPK